MKFGTDARKRLEKANSEKNRAKRTFIKSAHKRQKDVARRFNYTEYFMENSRFERAINLSKDVVVLIRDSSIIVLAVLLLAFPIKFNSILVEAGFEEGSVVGFKWKSKLIESTEALEKANESIESLKQENNQLLAALEDAKAQISDSNLRAPLINTKTPQA